MSSSSKPPPPQEESIEVIDLTRPESEQDGWDPNGAWKAKPDAESWGSPSTTNDPVRFPVVVGVPALIFVAILRCLGLIITNDRKYSNKR
jgi:hypothetical protein